MLSFQSKSYLASSSRGKNMLGEKTIHTVQPFLSFQHRQQTILFIHRNNSFLVNFPSPPPPPGPGANRWLGGHCQEGIKHHCKHIFCGGEKGGGGVKSLHHPPLPSLLFSSNIISIASLNERQFFLFFIVDFGNSFRGGPGLETVGDRPET